ncbi:thioredoxin domain-containing protein [Candidatus Micrarchaeota archaeon]|nr:thioredoxin domain-containing protein [Candidatus Micrarchaeota archaeon]
MVLCIVAFFVFAVMSIFSAKYRPLAGDAFQCIFKTLTLKPCDTGLDDRIKSDIVSSVLRISPTAAKLTNTHFALFSWIFVILTVASFGYSAVGIYNFYFYGNCDGPQSIQACILNDLTGDYGRFREPVTLIVTNDTQGIALGNPDASNTIIEFGCFTCPYTKKAQGTMEQLVAKHDVYYVFKPFPLPNHDFSYEAAKAVLCANRQNKSLKMRDSIFAQQEACGESGELALKALARQSGLDMDEFSNCYDNNDTVNELELYIRQGEEALIYATPTFFVNGKAVVGPKSLEEFEALLNEE